MKMFLMISAIMVFIVSAQLQSIEPLNQVDQNTKNQRVNDREKTFIINALTLISEKNELIISSNARLQLNEYNKLSEDIQRDKYPNAYQKGELIFFIKGKNGTESLIKVTFNDINKVINKQTTLIKITDSSGNFLGTIFGNSINVSPFLLKNPQTPPKNSNDASNYNDQSYVYPSQYEGARGAAIGAGSGF